MNNSIGCFLKEWRKHRRYSQLQLSLELGISSKHVSFIETGRSSPSREMVVKIGEFLFLPKREINRGLYLAGYAPMYTDLPSGHENLKPVFSAIDKMIENHMPYPALVMNQNWDVVKVNESANELLVELGYSGHKNLIEALIFDDPKTSKVVNWHETALSILVRLRQEISISGGSSRLEELETKLSLCLPENTSGVNIGENQVVSPTVFKVGSNEISFFSIISQLSTVQDVTVNEFRVELMFPSDEITKKIYTG